MEGQEGAGNQDLTGTSPALKDAVEHFRSIGWTREVLDKQQYRPTKTSFRIGKLEPQEDTFFGQTLNSSLTISHWLFLVHQDFSPHPENSVSASSKVPLQSSPPVPHEDNCFFLLQFGTGLWGFKDTMHGGAICAVLDQCLTLCAGLHRAASEDTRGTLYTGSLEVIFRGPILVPGAILVECWLEARKGRKWFVRGCIRGESGRILVEATGCWVLSSTQML